MPFVLNPQQNSRVLVRADPTRTALIRRRFQAEMKRRFHVLKRDIWEFLVTLDALGLASGNNATARVSELIKGTIAPGRRYSRVLTVNAKPQLREFQFTTSAGKLTAFRDWLSEQVKAKILSPSPDGLPGKPWTAKYIESAYKKGMVNAFRSTKKKEAVADLGFVNKAQDAFLKSAFGQPETTTKIELLSTRAFEELKGITEVMSTQLNRALAKGLVDGSGVRDIAKEILNTVDGITDKRALLLARTEIIHAHAEGQLDSFKDLGVEELGIEAEWSTAGDDRVCTECEAMEGQVFSVDESHGMIPLHPGCRCTWVPHIPDHLLK
jgi:SPP1 gp7 family putative phage head morphogenesis protein